MLKAYKYRIYPTDNQKVLLEKHFGCCRFLHNLALETKQSAWAGHRKNLSFFDLVNQLPGLKKDLPWLSEVSAQSLQMVLRNLDGAFVNFYKGRAGFPKFKSKKERNSFQCPQYVKVDFEKGIINLPKFKNPISTVFDRKFVGDIKTVTVSKTPTNKYFVSVLVDNHESVPEKKRIEEHTSVAIDLGITSLMALDDGTKVDGPSYLRNGLGRIKYLQKKRSKKNIGSNRYKIYSVRIARKHEKVANQRKDFAHKLSDSITKNYDTICLETLNVSGMVKNHSFALSIHDCGWSEIVRQIKYKSEWRGKNVVQIGTFEPSSKLCSSCGSVNRELTLADREWQCRCGVKHDRDVNAAKNIKNFALKKSGVERTAVDVELPTLVGAVKRQHRS